jgi:hypothetical protein
MAVREILRYLIDHPDAKDTIQGILQWWLPGGLVIWEEEDVREALELLVAKGWLTQRQTTPSQKIYGVNTEKLEEIKAFLRGLEHETDGPRE